MSPNRMGVLAGDPPQGSAREVRVVDHTGNFHHSVESPPRSRYYISRTRGDLAASIFGTIESKVGVDFSTTASLGSIGLVRVTFGIRHDHVISFRSLEPTGFIRECAASFLVRKADSRSIWGTRSQPSKCQGYRLRDELVYVMYTKVGSRLILCGDRACFFWLRMRNATTPSAT